MKKNWKYTSTDIENFCRSIEKKEITAVTVSKVLQASERVISYKVSERNFSDYEIEKIKAYIEFRTEKNGSIEAFHGAGSPPIVEREKIIEKIILVKTDFLMDFFQASATQINKLKRTKKWSNSQLWAFSENYKKLEKSIIKNYERNIVKNLQKKF
jgi:hypothetical protein